VTIPFYPVVVDDDGTGSATTTIEDVTEARLFGEDKERSLLPLAKTKEGQGFLPSLPAPILFQGQVTLGSRRCPRVAERTPLCCSLPERRWS
jgi:hypothetical protein